MTHFILTLSTRLFHYKFICELHKFHTDQVGHLKKWSSSFIVVFGRILTTLFMCMPNYFLFVLVDRLDETYFLGLFLGRCSFINCVVLVWLLRFYVWILLAFTGNKQTSRSLVVFFGLVFSQIGRIYESDSPIFVPLNQCSRVRLELSWNAILNFAFIVEKTVRISSPRHNSHEKSITKLHGRTKVSFFEFFENIQKNCSRYWSEKWQI